MSDENVLMRIVSAENPRSRYHVEQLPGAHTGWTCIPLRDVVGLRDRAIDEPEWRVHDHGPGQGRGTACREYHLNGRLVGACLIIAATGGSNPG